jgi:hypothetical protein
LLLESFQSLILEASYGLQEAFEWWNELGVCWWWACYFEQDICKVCSCHLNASSLGWRFCIRAGVFSIAETATRIMYQATDLQLEHESCSYQDDEATDLQLPGEWSKQQICNLNMCPATLPIYGAWFFSFYYLFWV